MESMHEGQGVSQAELVDTEVGSLVSSTSLTARAAQN